MLNKILKVLIYSIIFLVPVFFLPFSFEVLEFPKLCLLFFLVWLSVLVWFLKMIVEDKEFKIKYSFVDYAVLVFLVIAVISSIFSVDRISSLFGYYGRFSTGLAGLLSLAAFYFLVLNNLGFKNRKTKAKNEETGEGLVTIGGIVKTLLYSGAVVMFFAYFSLFGIWLKLSRASALLPFVSKVALRVSPVSGSLEGMAMFLALLVTLAAMMALGLLTRFTPSVQETLATKRLERKSLQNVLVGIFILAAFLLLIIADSTGAWIVLCFGLLALVVLVLRKRVLKKEVHRLILPIALIIISVLFLILNFRTLIGSFPNFILNSSPGFLAERALSQDESWGIAGRAVISGFKNAAIGSGPGTFFYDFSKFKLSSLNAGALWSIRFDRSGSAISEILATMGFLGLLSFLTIIGSLLWMIFSLAGIVSSPFLKGRKGQKLDIGTIMLLTVFLAIALIQLLYYQLVSLNFLFWLFLALVIAWQGLRAGEDGREVIKTKSFRLKDYVDVALILETISIVLFLAFVVICFFGFKVYLADVKYVKALNQPGLDIKAQLLQDAIKLSPKQIRYQMVLSKVFLTKAQQDLAVLSPEGDQDEIIQNLRAAQIWATNAANVSSNQVMAWQNLAELYQGIIAMSREQAQFIDLAIVALEKAVALEPSNPKFYTDIGSLYLILGKNEEAKAEFERAVGRKTDYAPAQIALALFLEEEGKSDEAIKKLEGLLARVSNDAEILFHLGRLYYNKGETERAIIQFKAALALNPNYSNARFSLGVAYEKQGKINDALEQFRVVAKFNPDNQELQKRIQRLERGETRAQEEIEVFEEEGGGGVIEGEEVIEETE